MSNIENVKNQLEIVREDVNRAPLEEIKEILTEVDSHSASVILDQAEAAILDMKRNRTFLGRNASLVWLNISTGVDKLTYVAKDVNRTTSIDVELAGMALRNSAQEFPESVRKLSEPIEGDPNHWLTVAQKGLEIARAALSLADEASRQCLQETETLISQRGAFVEQVDTFDRTL